MKKHFKIYHLTFLIICYLIFWLDNINGQFSEQFAGTFPNYYQGSIVWGDYDNDGLSDVLVNGIDDSKVCNTKLFHNTGSGFSEVYSGTFVGIAGKNGWVDFNNDGLLDIVSAGYETNGAFSMRFYKNIGTGFTEVYSGQVTAASPDFITGDFNNDGLMDIFVSGTNNISYQAKLYKNTGSGFTEVYPGSIQGLAGNYEFGDFDNDGDLDLIISGEDSYKNANTKIYRNDGNGFTEVNKNQIAAISRGEVKWGDYDNDGALDILISGRGNNGPITKVYHNESGQFKEVFAGLFTPLMYSSVVWVDYDGDGKLDILETGYDGTGSSFTKVYQNTGSSFKDTLTGLFAGKSYGAIGVCDYDNDGDLDIMLLGSEGDETKKSIQLYRNSLKSNLVPFNVNTLPSIVDGLKATINDSILILNWKKATDSQTSTDALTYNVYIYKEGENNFIKSPNAFTQKDNKNGISLISQFGKIHKDTAKFVVRNFAEGNYKWSIQAVDNGLKSGLFCSESTFNFIDLGKVKIEIVDKLLTNTSTSMQYSINSTNGIDGTWMNCESTNTTVDYGTKGGFGIWIRNIANTSNFRKVATIAVPITPNISIDFINENTKDIISSNVEYSDNISFTNLKTGTGTKINIIPGNNLFIRYKETSTTLMSNVQNLIVPNRLTPNYHADDKNKTTVEIIPSLVEYSNFADMSGALKGKFLKVAIKPDGNLYLRTIATDTSFLSNILKLSVSVGQFSEQFAGTFPNYYQGSIVWGDYDNDGLSDVLVNGIDDSKVCNTKLFHNTGSGFSEVYSGTFVGIAGKNGWVDFNNDGLLDIVSAGYETNGAFSMRFYKNIGTGFTEVYSGQVTAASPDFITGDFNNDGLMDIFVSGTNNISYQAKLYKNTGSGFTEVYPGSIQGLAGNYEFGDFDNDGDLDLIISGEDSYKNANTKIYRNDGNGFTEVNKNQIAAISRGEVKWGDYDNDGALDILISGRGNNGPITKVYHNESGQFKEVFAGLFTPLMYSSVVWVDYDGDGKLDILETGYDGTGSSFTKVYQNTGSSFKDTLTGLFAGKSYGAIGVCDYDNDGDLDIMLLGSEGDETKKSIQLYRNSLKSNLVPFNVNTRPNQITNLSASLISKSTENSNLWKTVFKWSIPSDNQTISNALTYNLYVYKKDSSTFLLSPNAFNVKDPKNGIRLISKFGNIQYNEAGYNLFLPEGNYLWSVQAIDQGYLGGKFAPETLLNFNTVNVKNTLENNVKIFPNPTTDIIQIEGVIENSTILLFDVTGKLKGSYKVSDSCYQIHVNEFQNGIYIIKYYDGEICKEFKFIKQ